MPILQGRAELEVLNIDSREDWRDAYDTRVPVVEIDGHFVCQYRLDGNALAAVLDGIEA
ncbi:MAG: glutaredoxin family protein [Woeseia sp.]